MRRWSFGTRTTLVVLAGALGACSEPDQPAQILVSPATVSFDALTDTEPLSAVVKNEKGTDLVGAVVTWESSNSGVASVDGSGTVTAVANGTAVIKAKAGAIEGTAAVTVDQVASQVDAASGGSQSGPVAQALPVALVTRLRDRLGNGVANVTVAFAVSTDGGSVSPTSAATGADGQVSTTWTFGTKAGAHTVTASPSGTASTIAFTGTATPGPAFVLSKAGGDAQFGYRGTRLAQLVAARVRDQYGNAIKDQVVAFAAASGEGTPDSTLAFSDSAGVARSGWVLPDALDTVSLTASAAGPGGGPLAGSPLTFTAIAHGLRVTNVSPSPLVEGQAAVLTGTGFDPTPANNTVMVGELAATVTTASPTQLDITVPSSDCRPARAADVTVMAGGFPSTPVAASLNPASSVSLAVGQQAILRDPAQFCFQFAELTGQEVYLIGVQSTSESVADLTTVSLSGFAAAPAAARPSSAAPRRPGMGIAPLDLARLERWRRHRAVEATIREDDRRAWETQPGASLGAAGAPRSVAALVDSTVAVGDTIRNIRITTGGGCSNFVDATTVVRARGQRGIFLEHITAPAGGFQVAHYNTFSQGFDTHYYPADTVQFGSPGDTDGNGRVVMVFTPEVNRREALGFTTSCDTSPRSSSPASNEGEFFYVRVPDTGGSFSDPYELSAGLDDIPPTLAHEFVHVIQFARRKAAGGLFPAIWLAEGQAVLGEEIVGHVVEGRTRGQDFGVSVGINLDDTTSIDWYSTGIVGLGLYFGWDPVTNPTNLNGRTAEAPHECSWLSTKPTNPGPCVGGLDPYGVPWALLRWLSDRFYPTPSAEAGFHQGITSNTENGYALLESLVGVSMDTLLAQFAAMLFVDGLVGSAASELTMSSWNLYDVFYGTDAATNLQLRPALRLQPAAVTYGTFTRNANVRGASTYYALLSGANREATAVKARDGGGGILPGFMRYWIVRIE